MPTRKKTKIVATLGPACSSKEVIKDMIDAGVNVFRINFSHADYTDVKERIDIIRELNDEQYNELKGKIKSRFANRCHGRHHRSEATHF